MECLGHNDFKYTYVKNLNGLQISHFEKWFSSTFPTLRDCKARELKNDYVEATYKFGQYLQFEMKLWDVERINGLKSQVRRAYVPPIHERILKIIGPERTDPFITYLKDISKTHYTMCYLMRYANMRYIEVVNARTDLKSGTLLEDFRNNRLIIYGKGRGGLSQQRIVPFFMDDQKVIRDYLKWRKKEGNKSDWLFCNQYGTKFSDHVGAFNDYLRDQGAKYGFSTDDLVLLTTHRIGRHGYGTFATQQGLQEKFIRENMGIRDPKILKRYQNTTDELRIEETRKKLKKEMKSNKLPEEDVDTNSKTDEERHKILIDMLLKEKISQEAFMVAAGLLQR